MQLNNLKKPNNKKDRKRIGRGGSRGTYSGRGIKGQKARAGTGMEPIIRGFIKRYPKLRGHNVTEGFKPAIVNVSDLESAFSDGDKVTPEILVKKRIVKRVAGKNPKVKVLGNGKINKALTIENCFTSKTAKEKIKKAGGSF